jgi:hypothetical protein
MRRYPGIHWYIGFTHIEQENCGSIDELIEWVHTAQSNVAWIPCSLYEE